MSDDDLWELILSAAIWLVVVALSGAIVGAYLKGC